MMKDLAAGSSRIGGGEIEKEKEDHVGVFSRKKQL